MRTRLLSSLIAAALVGAPALASAQAVNNYPLTTASAASPCPAESCVEVPGFPNGVAVQIAEPGSAGTWTVQFEGTLTGATWVALSLTPPGTTTSVTSATAAGIWRGAAGMRFRVRLSAWTSGAPRITIQPLDTPPVSGGGGAGGSGTEYTEGDVDATITGGAMLWEDTGDTLRAVSAAKPLPVAIISGAGSGGTAVADRSGTFTPNVTSFTPVGGIMDEVASDACTEGAPCVARVTANRSVYVTGANGTFPVTDNAGSLTVDAPVATPVFVRLSDGASAIATLPVSLASVPSHAVTNAGTFVVQENGAALTALQLIDDPVVTLGTTTYTEATSKGFTLNAVRRDANTTLVDTTNEMAPLQVDANGNLKVAIISGAGSGGTALADNAAFTPGTTSFTPIGGEVDDTGTTAATENSAAAARMTVQRAIHVNIRSAAGVEQTLATDLTVGSAFGTTGPGVMGSYKEFDGSALPTTTNVNTEEEANPFAVTLQGISYGFLTNENGSKELGKLEDDPHATADYGVPVWTKRTDVAAVSSGTDADYSTLNVDALGLAWTRTLDPCSGVAKTFLPFNISTATTTEITPSLAGASTNYYVCSIVGVSAAANNVAIVDDDTDNCASVTAGMAGGTTAATGFNFGANGGFTFGNGGASIMKTNGTNRVVCIVTSAATQLSGVMAVVAAP